ncbi:hypothetical protein FS749_000261 [Ceratobasidium sp. UAMH 11750]|nr:hypothetical protein FS749_000261 [Ceratobasidium sp. UAMH 11750]
MATPTSFKAWNDSRKHLEDAIQRYLEHSQALEAAVLYRRDGTFGCGALDELFAEVREEQASTSPRNEKLKQASVALNRIYNQSTTFVPIRSLSHDVLVYIFTLVWDKCRFFPSSDREITRCEITKTILAVSHVCTDWRRLAINTPTLWTHVDIIDNGRYNCGRGEWDMMWLGRAGSAPLSVQVAIQGDVERNYTKGALNWLVPHLSNVCSLGLHADSHHKLQAALAYWMSNGTPGVVQDLSLTGRSEPLPWYNNENFMDELPLERAIRSSFLAPIRILRLKHVSISYSSEVFCDLVHLELVSIPSMTCPTIPVLARWLDASPDLRILKLEMLDMGLDRYSPPREIELNVLERLDLVKLSRDPCSRLLPLLKPGPGELSLRLEAPINSTNAEAVRSFLDRSNVTKLYIKAPYPDWSLAVDCFATINDLRMLVVDFNEFPFNECDAFLKALLLLRDPSTSSTSRWPNLRTLWLIEGAFDFADIKNTIKGCHVRTLILSLVSSDWMAKRELGPLVHLITEDALPNVVIGDWDTRC